MKTGHTPSAEALPLSAHLSVPPSPPVPVSICIAARNEEATIEMALRSVLCQCRGRRFEVLVCANGCRDRTAERVNAVALSLAERSPETSGEAATPVHLIVTESPGKPAAWNLLLRRARYPYLVFMDADVRLGAGAIHRLVHRLRAEPQLVAVGGRPVPVLQEGGFLMRLLARPPYEIGGLVGRLYAVHKGRLLQRMHATGHTMMPQRTISDDGWVTLVAGRRLWKEAREAQVRFIVLTRARSGSNYLMTLLASHPAIAIPPPFGEVFLSQNLLSRPDIRAAPVAHLRVHVFRPVVPWVRAAGFKLMYGHARAADGSRADPGLALLTNDERRRLERIWSFLEQDRGVRVIHLWRRNMLRAAVSLQIALQTGQWQRHSLPDDDRQGPGAAGARHDAVSFRIDCAAVLENLRKTEERRNRCLELFASHPLLQVTYEELTSHTRTVAGEIEDFLEVSRHRLTSSLVRQNLQPLRLLVSNYAELARALAGTKWEQFLDEEGM